jgi:hypothetical protein
MKKHKAPHCPKCENNKRVIYQRTGRFVSGNIFNPVRKMYSIYKCCGCGHIIDQVKDGATMVKTKEK